MTETSRVTRGGERRSGSRSVRGASNGARAALGMGSGRLRGGRRSAGRGRRAGAARFLGTSAGGARRGGGACLSYPPHHLCGTHGARPDSQGCERSTVIVAVPPADTAIGADLPTTTPPALGSRTCTMYVPVEMPMNSNASVILALVSTSPFRSTLKRSTSTVLLTSPLRYKRPEMTAPRVTPTITSDGNQPSSHLTFTTPALSQPPPSAVRARNETTWSKCHLRRRIVAGQIV